jgi:hypothetical protein
MFSRMRNNPLWKVCGRNNWNVAGNEWERMSADVKTLDFARGCNSIQNQQLTFSTSLHSGQ